MHQGANPQKERTLVPGGPIAAVLALQVRELDPAKRKVLLDRVQDYLAETMPIVPTITRVYYHFEPVPYAQPAAAAQLRQRLGHRGGLDRRQREVSLVGSGQKAVRRGLGAQASCLQEGP